MLSVLLVERKAAASAVEVGSLIFSLAVRADDYIGITASGLIFAVAALCVFKAEALRVLVLVEAMTVFLVAFPMVRRAALGADNYIVAVDKSLGADGAGLLSKFHKFLRVLSYYHIIPNKHSDCNKISNNNYYKCVYIFFKLCYNIKSEEMMRGVLWYNLKNYCFLFRH